MTNSYLIIPSLTPKQLDAFWRRVDKKTPTVCWSWIGCRNHLGYGHFRIQRKIYVAHRVAFAIANGKTPVDLEICHHCDHPWCVNPTHLFAGTQYDNMVDMAQKGRRLMGDNHPLRKHPECVPRGKQHWSKRAPEKYARGEKTNHAKVSAKDVVAIRKQYRKGTISMVALGKIYRINGPAICKIVHHKNWRHIA